MAANGNHFAIHQCSCCRVYQCAIHVYSTTTVKPAGGGAEDVSGNIEMRSPHAAIYNCNRNISPQIKTRKRFLSTYRVNTIINAEFGIAIGNIRLPARPVSSGERRGQSNVNAGRGYDTLRPRYSIGGIYWRSKRQCRRRTRRRRGRRGVYVWVFRRSCGRDIRASAPPPPQAAINTKAAAANIGNGKTERRGIERFILFILNVFSISVIDYSIISPPFPLSPSFPSKSSSFPPPPTRGQIAAGINCHRAANADGAKRHLTTGGKAAAN